MTQSQAYTAPISGIGVAHVTDKGIMGHTGQEAYLYSGKKNLINPNVFKKILDAQFCVHNEEAYYLQGFQNEMNPYTS